MSSQSTSVAPSSKTSTVQQWKEDFSRLLGSYSDRVPLESLARLTYYKRIASWDEMNDEPSIDQYIFDLEAEQDVPPATREVLKRANRGAKRGDIVSIPREDNFEHVWIISEEPNSIDAYIKPLIPVAQAWSEEYNSVLDELATIVQQSLTDTIMKKTPFDEYRDRIDAGLARWRDHVDFRESIMVVTKILARGYNRLKEVTNQERCRKACGISTNTDAQASSKNPAARMLYQACELAYMSTILSEQGNCEDTTMLGMFLDVQPAVDSNDKKSASVQFLLKQMAPAIAKLMYSAHVDSASYKSIKDHTETVRREYRARRRVLREITDLYAPNILTLGEYLDYYRNSHSGSKEPAVEPDAAVPNEALLTVQQAAGEAAKGVLAEIEEDSQSTTQVTAPKSKRGKKGKNRD